MLHRFVYNIINKYFKWYTDPHIPSEDVSFCNILPNFFSRKTNKKKINVFYEVFFASSSKYYCEGNDDRIIIYLYDFRVEIN